MVPPRSPEIDEDDFYLASQLNISLISLIAQPTKDVNRVVDSRVSLYVEMSW